MTTTPAQGRRPRRVQRFVVGLAMSMVAFFLDRIVSRALKRGAGG